CSPWSRMVTTVCRARKISNVCSLRSRSFDRSRPWNYALIVSGRVERAQSLAVARKTQAYAKLALDPFVADASASCIETQRHRRHIFACFGERQFRRRLDAQQLSGKADGILGGRRLIIAAIADTP